MMSDEQTDPILRHVQAVAWCVWSAERAERLLTSTDPAVLDALQDALVRAGRLREDHQVARGPESWAIALRHGRVVHERRLVTEWTEETP